MVAPVRTRELRRLLEKGLEERDGRAASVGLIERRPFERATSYHFERVCVHIGEAERIDLVIKDFGSSRLPKDDPATRGEREATVYRELLDGAGLGTAGLFGIVRDPVRLALEYVDGTSLKHHGLGMWVEAAAWLGTFQARMAERSRQVAGCRVLVRHDAAFFHAHARAAETSVAAFGPRAVRRLGAVLDRYDRFVEAMTEQPRTLVHGSFRPQNIVVSTPEDGPVRICPVDWELAGLGSPLYDLAFLAEGFRGAELDRLLAAYLLGAGRPGTAVDSGTLFAVDCFRLHKIVKSVGDAVALAFRPATVQKLLAMGEELRDRLG